MAQQGGRIDFQVGFKADKSGINDIKKSLQDLQRIKIANFDGPQEDLKRIKNTAKQVQSALTKAFNPNLNTINLKTFNSSLKESDLTINKIYSDFSQAGAQGQVAFNKMATSVLTTNQSLKQTENIVTKLGQTFVNTIKWNIASSAINTFTSGVQNAFTYVQHLQKSLTNIRIVTGDSQQKMEEFAASANRAAQELGRSTMDYTKAALTFYQQGLNDEDVQARTEAVLKAQNITGAGSQMADYLTSVWNGYKVANEQAQVYVDKLAAVADTSASDMSQLAIGMSKVASTANTMGVDIDQLNAQLATVIATTRQAPEAVGTAFKTIYTRMNDIKTGSDEAEISLGNYSGKMAELGFNVLDATGHLRDTGQVMQEIGSRWEDLTREQQVYLATTMGGQRQVNQLMALFDNWTTYSELLNTSLESEGTLAQKNSVYLESLGAKMEQLGAAGEKVKDNLVDSQSFGKFIDILTKGTDLLGTFVESIDGGGSALLGLGGIATQVFSGTIAKEINKIVVNFQNMKFNMDQVNQQLRLIEDFGNSQGYQQGAIDEMLNVKRQMIDYSAVMTEQDNREYNAIVKKIGAEQQYILQLQDKIEKGKEYNEIIQQAVLENQKNGIETSFNDVQMELQQSIEDITKSLSDFRGTMASGLEKDNFTTGLITEFEIVNSYLNNKLPEGFNKTYEELTKERDRLLKESENIITEDVSRINQRIINLIKTAVGSISENFNFSLDVKTNTAEIELARDRIQELKGDALQLQQSLKQALSIKGGVEVVGALGSMSSAILSMQKGLSSLTDENLSPLEKMQKVLMSIGYSLPMLITSYQKLSTWTKTFTGAITKAMTIQQQKMAIEKAEEALNKAKIAREQAEIALKNKNNALLVVENNLQQKDVSSAMKLAGAKLKVKQATEAAATAKEKQALATKELESAQTKLNLSTNLFSKIGIVAAIVAVVLVAKKLYEVYNQDAIAAQRAAKAAQETKKTYDDLKTSLEDTKKALEDLRSSESALQGLSRGTEEWKNALQDCNNKVLELISNYPQLAKYVENTNGQLTISQEGQEAYLNQLEQGVKNAQNASYIANSNANQQQIYSDAAAIGHRSIYTYEDRQSNGKMEEESASATRQEVIQIVQAIDKIIDSGGDLSQGLNGLKDQIVNETDLNEALVDAVLSNEQAVLALRDQMQENALADKVMYQGMAENNLMNNSTYSGADDLGKQVISAIGGADLQAAVKDAQEEWLKKMEGSQMSRFDNAASANVQEILKALNDAQNTNWSLDSNAVRGGDNERTIAFLDEQHQVQILTKEQIASTIAAKQALQELGVSAENAAKMLTEIDSLQIMDSAKSAIKQWVAGQDMTNINQAGLDNIQGKTLNEIFGGDEEQLQQAAKARGIEIEGNEDWQSQLEKDWSDSCNYLSTAFDEVAKDATDNVKNAWETLKKDNDIKEATLGTQQQLVEDMRQAFTKGGEEGLKTLTDFFSKTEDLDSLKELSEGLDFNTLSVENFKTALEEAGISTSATNEEIQRYIETQKQLSEVLSPEQNYKNVHDITDGLKRGDTIDAEQAETLKTAGINVDAFFSHMANGSLKLKVNAEDFQSYINQITLEPFKNKIDELQNKINGIQSFQQTDYAAGNDKGNTFEDFSSMVSPYEQGSYDIDKIEAQLQFLRAIGEEDQHITQVETDLQNSRVSSYESLKAISDLVKEHANDYNDLNGKVDQYKQNIQILNEQMQNANQLPLDADVDTDKWESLTEHIQEYAQANDELADSLATDIDTAQDVAQAILRFDSAIGQVKDHYEEWLEALSSDSIEDQVQALDELENAYSDILDLPFDNVLSDSFLRSAENLNLLREAANGSEQAYNQLAQAAAKDILINCGIDTSQFDIDKSYIESFIFDEGAFPDLEIGASLDSEPFLNGLTDMINAAHMTQEQATDYLANMGVDAQIIQADSEATETKEQTGFHGQPVPTPLPYEVPIANGMSVSTVASTGLVTGVNWVPDENLIQDKKENKAFSLKVVSAKKSSGGGFKFRNSSAGNKGKGGGGGGGRGKKGRGGKGKKGSSKTPKTQKPITDKPDRYHDVNLKLKDIDNDLSKIQKQQDKLTGKDLLNNLNKQLKLLEKQVATYKEKLELERQQANQIRSRLKKQGATFDPNGNISNYSKLLTKALNEYNDAVARYNKMSAEEQQKNKDLLENAKLKYENLKKDIQRYDKIISEEIPGLEKSIQEAIDKQTEINIQKFKIKVDLEMDMSEAQREFNEFARKVKKQLRDDDILGNAKSYLKDYSSYYKGGYDVIQGLTDQVFNTLAEINNINKQGISSIYGTDKAAALKDLQEYTQALMSNLEDIEDVVANIKDSIFDAIDKAQDAFDEQKKEYEYIADLIEHNQKVVELLYGEDAYKQLQKYYELQEKNNKDQLDFLRQQKEMWYSRMEEERARMNNLTEGTNAWKEANDRFEEYKRHWMDAVDDINSQIEDSLDNLIDKYTNAVDKIFLVFENNITNGKGLDNIAEEWQLIGKQADQYLDKVNSMYEIDKLENAYKDAIDDNDGNIKAQQSLNNLMNEQLKYLKDKDKLTQYDVDRANALLQIEIKRLALEQARQSKTKLRLRRDAQGNYTYQYTADQDATRQAQQELADAQNSLYNLTKQAYKNNLDDYYDTTEEMNEKIRDVYKDTTLSAEEQNQKIAMIYEYYGDIINNLTQQNEDLKKFMMEDTFNEMAKMYNTNVQNFKNMTDEEKDILMNDMVPYWKSSIQDMADTFAGAGGFGPITQDLFNDLIDNSKDYQNSLDEIGKIAGVSLEDIKNATDVNIQRAETLLEKNDELIDSYNEEMSKVQQVINEVERLVQTYQRAKDAAIQATEAAYEYTQRESANTANQLIDNKNTAGKSQYTKAAAFDTGGYTGDWGDVGKTAILHEKEIVLNAQDTINLLSAVKITRTLSDIISNFNMEPIGLGRVVNNTNNSSNSTSQNITIHADFPNVTEKSEIEAAFNNLVNKASQYAFRK